MSEVPATSIKEATAPSVATTTTTIFHEWDLVKIGGLKSPQGKPLNGTIATVIKVVPDDGEEEDRRYECHVRGQAGTRAFKPCNLMKMFPHVQVINGSEIHGRGLVATQPIEAHTKIMWEKALLPPMDFSSQVEFHLHLAAELEELSEADRTQLEKLHAAPTPALPSNFFQALPIVQVISCNQFAFAGVCPTLSFANHSCNANAFFVFDEEKKVEVFYSLKDIAEGEEILVNYFAGDEGAFATTRERQTFLMMSKGFMCKCSLCTMPTEQREARDDVVSRIKALFDQFPQTAMFDTLRAYHEGIARFKLMESIKDTLPLYLFHNFVGELVQLFDKYALSNVVGLDAEIHWRAYYSNSFKFSHNTTNDLKKRDRNAKILRRLEQEKKSHQK